MASPAQTSYVDRSAVSAADGSSEPLTIDGLPSAFDISSRSGLESKGPEDMAGAVGLSSLDEDLELPEYVEVSCEDGLDVFSGKVEVSEDGADEKPSSFRLMVWDRSPSFGRPESVMHGFIKKSMGGAGSEPLSIVTRGSMSRDESMVVLLVHPSNVKEGVPPGSYMVLGGRGVHRVKVKVDVTVPGKRGDTVKEKGFVVGVVPPIMADNPSGEVPEAVRVAQQWTDIHLRRQQMTFELKPKMDYRFVPAEAMIVPSDRL